MISHRRRTRPGIGRWTERGVLLTCGVAAGALAARMNRRGARRAAGAARGAMHSAARAARGGRHYDDATLARMVESRLAHLDGAPKGRISVNAADAVVELRGQVPAEQIARIGKAAKGVAGVRDVHNLLHAPGTTAPHAPPSPPGEVRARAARHGY